MCAAPLSAITSYQIRLTSMFYSSTTSPNRKIKREKKAMLAVVGLEDAVDLEEEEGEEVVDSAVDEVEVGVDFKLRDSSNA